MQFLVPKLSATMERARVVRWLKKVGDRVAICEPLVELETDKATMEVESPVDATFEAMLAEQGAELPIGAALARLATGDAAAIGRGTAPNRILAAPTAGAEAAADARPSAEPERS